MSHIHAVFLKRNHQQVGVYCTLLLYITARDNVHVVIKAALAPWVAFVEAYLGETCLEAQ